jgi:hypothetical protein
MTMDQPTNWQLQRRMRPDEYLAAIEYLGMNQADAGRFLGVTPRTSARYAKGDTEVPEMAALLLGLMIHAGFEPVVPKSWRKS